MWLRTGSNPADINRFRSHTGIKVYLAASSCPVLAAVINGVSLLDVLVSKESKFMVFPTDLKQISIILFPVSRQNRLISGGLEPVLSHAEKLCIASFYILCISSNIKSTNIRLNPVFSALACGILEQ